MIFIEKIVFMTAWRSVRDLAMEKIVSVGFECYRRITFVYLAIRVFCNGPMKALIL